MEESGNREGVEGGRRVEGGGGSGGWGEWRVGGVEDGGTEWRVGGEGVEGGRRGSEMGIPSVHFKVDISKQRSQAIDRIQREVIDYKCVIDLVRLQILCDCINEDTTMWAYLVTWGGGGGPDDKHSHAANICFFKIQVHLNPYNAHHWIPAEKSQLHHTDVLLYTMPEANVETILLGSH